MTIGRLQEGAERAATLFAHGRRRGADDEIALLREEIRRIVLEELRSALGGRAGG